MREPHAAEDLGGIWPPSRSVMNIAAAPTRFCAVAMELAAYLDGHYVEMRILTDTGKTVSIVCERDSIFAVQRHIERLGQDCPEIATWKPAVPVRAPHDDGHRSYASARSERRHKSLAGPILVGTVVAGPAAVRE